MNTQKDEIKKKLNTQLVYAAVICALFTISMIIYFAFRVHHKDENLKVVEDWGWSISSYYTLSTWPTAAMALVSMPAFVLWILGIINATKINKLTGDGVVLIVFSVLLLWIAQVITVIVYRNSTLNRLESQEKTDAELRKQNEENKPKDNDF